VAQHQHLRKNWLFCSSYAANLPYSLPSPCA